MSFKKTIKKTIGGPWRKRPILLTSAPGNTPEQVFMKTCVEVWWLLKRAFLGVDCGASTVQYLCSCPQWQGGLHPL